MLFETRLEITKFIESIVTQTKACYLLIPPRKSSHLFHSFAPRFLECGFSLGSIQIFSIGEKEIAMAPVDIPKEVGLLVDSIDRGKECLQIVSALNPDIRVNKIFCFLANAEGLVNLEKHGISRDKIVAHRTVPSDDYEATYKKLLPFYQSRIEPMDIGLVFDSYEVLRHINEREFLQILTTSVQKAFKYKRIKFRKKKLLVAPKGTHAYSFDYPDFDACTKNISLLNDIPVSPSDIEFLSIDIRVSCRVEGIHFRIASLCPPHITLANLTNNKTCVLKSKIKECYINRLTFKKKYLQDIQEIFCPQCIENTISRRILDLLFKNLKGQFRGHYSRKKYDAF